MKSILFLLLCLFSNDVFTQPETTDFERLDQHLKTYITGERLAGIATLVMKNDTVLYKSNLGWQDLEKKQPITDQTLFRLASLTKPIVSVGILKLLDQGKLSLDAPISKYLPFFQSPVVLGQINPIEQPIRIHHLLSHTSGITSELAGGEVAKLYKESLHKGQTSLEAFIKDLASFPLEVAPGTRFLYSYSPDVLGLIIEKISGQPLDQFLKEQVFEPLEMNSTSFKVAPERIDDFASIFTYNEQKQLVLVQPNKESPYLKGVMPRGNSGLVSTVTDYSHFALMLLNKGQYNGQQYLQEETVALMVRNHVPTPALPIGAGPITFSGLGFGYGVAVSYEPNPLGTIPGTYGWIGASHTTFWVDPANGLFGVLFTQFSGKAGDCPILFEFNPLVYRCLAIKENGIPSQE
ncbi:MAG: serine hydrolase domain-containing protein [Saprospiraceae bacterium]